MDLIRLVFFLHLLILQVAQRSVAIEIDGENWRKTTTLDDQVINQIHIDDRSKLSNRPDSVPKGEGNVLRLHSMDFPEENSRKGIHEETQVPHQHVHMSTHSLSSHVDDDHMDPSVLVFFNLEDLKMGKTMLVHFPDRFLSSSNFLPKEAADKIPFSSKQLPTLLQFFSFPQGSPQATAMEDTLRECEAKPIERETKLCATSMASMLDFAKHIFGSTVDNNKIQLLSTIYLTKLTAELQKYTVTEVPKEISASKMIPCHTMPYPYGILYCHYQDTESKVYRVQLVSEHGDKIKAIAVCHMDTSQWSPNHISFRVLGIEPGSQPVCHFFPADNLVLLPPADFEPVKAYYL